MSSSEIPNNQSVAEGVNTPEQSGVVGNNSANALQNGNNELNLQKENESDNESNQNDIPVGGQVPQSVPQGEYGENAAQVGGAQETAARLRERIESTQGDSKSGLREVENRVTRDFAQDNGLWIENEFKLGVPFPSGDEHNNYIDAENQVVYKVNNRMHTPSILDLLDRIEQHNKYFPNTQYRLVGFTAISKNGDVMPVFAQGFVPDARMATVDEIDSYMGTLGFTRVGDGRYSNGEVVIKDLKPRNVLADADGDIYVVDAEFEQENAEKSGEIAENESEKMYSPEELAEAKEQLGELNAISAPAFAVRLFSIKPWKTLEEANAALKELLASYGETLNGQTAAVLPFLDEAQRLISENSKNQEPRSTEDEAPVTSETTEQPETNEVANAGPVNMDTLQLNMSDEDFNALLNSGDKTAISEYLAELDGTLRIDENSPFVGQVALREEYRKAVEQYGKENIPAEVMDDLNSRMQPYRDLSRAIFDRKYALQDRLREIEATEQRAKELAEKEAKAERKQTAFGGFLAGKTDLGASTAEKALSKKYNFDGKVMTVAEFVEDAVDRGDVKLSTIEEPKYKGASRAAWNRMDARQQEADAKRVKESGTKTVYTVNDHDLGKTAYDYAKFLQENTEKQQGSLELDRENPAFERATKATMDAVERLKANGLDIEVVSQEEANAMAELAEMQKRTAPETVSVQDEHLQTVVSSADGAKVLKDLDNAINEYEKDIKTKEKTFLGRLAEVLNAKKHGSNSQYATFEAVNGKVFTIRLANHNAKVSTFDNHDENEGISIVVTAQDNNGVTNDGNAHLVEFFYDAIKLRKADGKPLVEILKSIKQALYSGEYKDNTGLAVREEVNIPEMMTVFHGSGAKFDRFDHSFMGTGEGAQAFGWGTYVTEVEGIGRTYATTMRDKLISEKHKENAIINKLAKQTLESSNGNKEEALDYLRGLLNESWSDKKRVKAQIKIIETGKFLPETKLKANLYTVDIPDDNGSNYLHWDEVVPDEVIDNLWDKLRNAYGEDVALNASPKYGQSGEQLYIKLERAFGGDKQASQFLNDMGFVGISYPTNATTGGRADGARNYVIFNEDDAKIEDRTMFRELTYDEAVQEAKNFEDKHKGSAQTVVIESYDTIESQLKNVNFTDEEIEDAKAYHKDGTIGVYFPTSDYVVINKHNVPKKKFNGYLWHENGHRAIEKLGIEDQAYFEKLLRANFPADMVESTRERLGEEYKKYWQEEALMEVLQEAKVDGSVFDSDGFIDPNRLPIMNDDLIDLFNDLINFIQYGGKERNAFVYSEVVSEDNGRNEHEVRNSEGARESERTTREATGGLTEGEINFLEAATGYSREEIIRLFGGNSTSFREMVQEQDNNEVERSKNMVNGLAEKFNTPVTIVENVDELPQNRRNKKGWFNPKTGEVVVVLPNHVSEEDVVQTVLHEVVGHKGLRAVMGEKLGEFLE